MWGGAATQLGSARNTDGPARLRAAGGSQRRPDSGRMAAGLLRRAGVRALAAGIGTRMLALFFVLLALWAVVSLERLDSTLVERLNSRVDEELTEEISDFGRLAADLRPASGQFTAAGLEHLFDTMLARNIVGDGEALATFVGGRPYRST